MKAFITQYALTLGIQERWGTRYPDKDGKMFCSPNPSGVESQFYGEGVEWHLTRESAVARAEKMRLAKLASLKKQIARLEALEFK